MMGWIDRPLAGVGIDRPLAGVGIDRVLAGTGTDRFPALLSIGPGPAVLGVLVQAPEGDVGAFADFLAVRPVPAVLLLAGALITGFSVALVAYLGVGAVLETFIARAIE